MVLVDTGAWFALHVPDDPNHAAALAWLVFQRQHRQVGQRGDAGENEILLCAEAENAEEKRGENQHQGDDPGIGADVIADDQRQKGSDADLR